MAEEITGAAKIKVFGVGGGGCNAVNQMIRSGIKSAEFVAVNTDRQALYTSLAERKLQIGEVATRGLGAGAKPEKGTEAALESKKDIENELKDVDMLFITAGMGGGTGTGAAPVIASIAKEHKILTVAVVTTPFKFEGKRRMMNAMEGLHKLKKNVDTLLVIPNEKLNDIMPKGTSVINAFMEADEVLRQAVQSISDLIVKPSYVNLDFADVKTVMEGKGLAHMGIGAASGQEKAVKAMRIAVSSPLLETNIEGAKNVILNFQGGTDMTLDEMTYACELVESIADPDANIIWGADMNQSMEGKVEVTIIATGFNIEEEEEEQPEGARALPIAVPPRPDTKCPGLTRPDSTRPTSVAGTTDIPEEKDPPIPNAADRRRAVMTITFILRPDLLVRSSRPSITTRLGAEKSRKNARCPVLCSVCAKCARTTITADGKTKRSAPAAMRVFFCKIRA